MKRVLYGVLILALLAVVLPALRRALATPGVQGGLGDVRSFMAAEVAYANANGGYFDLPSCLAAPNRCLPSAHSGQAGFLDAGLAQLQPREGYQFRFEAGPAPSLSDAERKTLSKSSITSFAVVAIPVLGGGQRRAFCGDSNGRVCSRRDGSMPVVKDGRCPEDCETLH
jgi:hypothetical protein